MHILVLTGGLPYPLTSGRLRQFHFIRELAREHRITLVATVPPGQPPEHARVLADLVARVEEVRSDRLSPRLALKLWSIATGALGVTRFDATAELARRLTALHAADPFDVVLDARLALPLRKVLPGVPIVTDICDTTSASLSGQLAYAPLHARPVILAKRREARHAEAAMARGSDHVVFASERDRRALVEELGVLPRSSVLPNGVDLEYWRRATSARPRDTIVFAGAMAYAPNDDAARFLIEEVMPLIRRARPGVRLTIVGRDPSHDLVAAGARAPQVEVTGFVDDVRPHLERASLVMAPLRFGTGIPNKILEAMAMEVPVVTTPVVAEGLVYGEEPAPLAVASGAEALAAAAIDILDGADHDPSPDTAARDWVSQRFVWNAAGARLEDILRSARVLLGEARPGGPDRHP